MSAAVLRGTVVEFDQRRGVGQVESDDGRRFFFHATAIADGSRTVAMGTQVAFVVVPGHGGRWDASALVPPPEAPLQNGLG